MRPQTLLVLAGGFGTRLRSAVADVPKPLAPVAGRPYLHYLVEQWIAQGVTKLIFLLHHQADLIETFLASWQSEGFAKDVEIITLTEPEPMGTGGAVAFAVRQCRLQESFMVANADTWLGSGVAQIAETTAPAMAIVRVENSERYGSVRIENDKVLAFKEKQDSAGQGWINAGLYHLHADVFQAWDGKPFSLERELFPQLAADKQLHAVRLDTDFIDIGIPDDYFRFCRWIESGKAGVL